jgi:hypothetical protein
LASIAFCRKLFVPCLAHRRALLISTGPWLLVAAVTTECGSPQEYADWYCWPVWVVGVSNLGQS